MIRKVQDISEAVFILDNLREEDIAELISIYGSEWKQKMISLLNDKDFLVFYMKNVNGIEIPAAMGGFEEILFDSMSYACVWLLSSNFIYENKIQFIKEIREQVKIAEKKYKVMFNYIYKSNYEAKRWLIKLGFKFDNPKPKNMNIPENFEFFYKNI